MSKISRIRIVNLNYNHDSIHVDDKTFDLGGESTLISLRNGGGKSVLVQMIVGLFVNKTYRDFADREFKSYFTTNKPTFLMTEWQLEHSEDRFLAGMMVRKNQKEDDDDEDLEMITFTGSYATGCRYDLDHLPIIKTDGDYRQLKGFAECKQVLEEISEEKNGDFRMYDMSSQSARGRYFKTLRQYQINHKEWESIIRKVNQKESGLSDLFQNAKDEKNLVENWFLKPIEDKLNQDKNKIEEFRNLTFKFMEQYKKNQSNIERKALIEKYFVDTAALQEEMERYVELHEEKNEVTANMVLYIRSLSEAIQKISVSIAEKEEQLRLLGEEIRQILYEQISYKIYGLQDEKQEAVRERYEQEVKITALTKDIADMEMLLMQYDCNRIYGEIKGIKAEKAEVDEKIRVLYSESDSSKSEIEKIGGTLYRFYHYTIQKMTEEADNRKQDLQAVLKEKEDKLAEKNSNEKEIQDTTKRIGTLEHAVAVYNETEERFNKDYRCELMRNIIGVYPDGFLDVKAREMEEEEQKEKNKLAGLSRKKAELETALLNLNQEEKANMISMNEQKHKIESLCTELANLENEKQERMRMIKYLGMKETDIDEKVLILHTMETNLRLFDIAKTEMITEKAGVEKQYRQLKEGKTMELPANVQEYFEQNGIETIYGMEWLTKNGRSVEENSDLVAQNPFIPYSVIMEKDTFERFKKIEEELYTSFPIPVIVRGELENALENRENHINTYGNIHFFIMFNEHLLDKQELLKMLAGLEKQIGKLEKQIADKTEDIGMLGNYRQNLERQTYSESLCAKIQKKIGEAKTEQEKMEGRQQALKKEKDANAQEQKKNHAEIEESKRRLDCYANRQREFTRLRDKYEIYEGDRKSLLREQSEAEERKQRQRELEKQLLEWEEKGEGFREVIKQYEAQIEERNKRAALYEAYAETAESEKPEDVTEPDVLEARYRALTQRISDAMDELKVRQTRLADSIAKKTKELSRKNKPNMPEERYRELAFSDEQYDAAENKIRSTKVELNAANEKNISYAEQIVSLGTKIDSLMDSLAEKTGEREPKAREAITDIQFEKRMQMKKYEQSSAEKELRLEQKKKNDFSAMENGVSEFSDDQIEVSEEKLAVIAKGLPDFEQAEQVEIEQYQKDIKKRLRDLSDALLKERAAMSDEIKRISLKKEYADDYFSKTFANLLSLIGNPIQISRQYDISRSAYQNQLEKMKVDLENIDKEQKNIEEMFLEYIRSINTQIAMIDKNSTITVRNKSIKMLRIQVPDWESEKEHFKMRLHDFFEYVIQCGLETLEENKNLMEYLGKVVSTKKLYDDVVGINNIKIKLYKIEEEKEMPISWAEVSANSGGEGFLSAFVILSCLLSYMRRDENDMFTSGVEGKVLIMDNPFAQTYSAHLLKPLMEMAKKTNTQLICLSGLGGDSIYNRFENIYVIRLMDSNIRKGVQRLETKHVKGAEVKKMVLSDFKTEQMNLFSM